MIFSKPLYPPHHGSDITLSAPVVAALLTASAALAIICCCCLYWRARNPGAYANGAALPEDLEQGLRP